VPSERWTFPATRDEVGPVRRAAVRFARENDVPDPALRDVALAISEAVTNAVLHAYCDREPGTVTLTVEVAGDGAMEVVVADQGRGHQPRENSPGMGIGTELMRRSADTVEVRPAGQGQGTEVHMTFSPGDLAT